MESSLALNSKNGSIPKPQSREFFLKALAHLSALFRTELSEPTIKAYLIELQLIDAVILSVNSSHLNAVERTNRAWENILQRCIRECRFFPTIADFWEKSPKPFKSSDYL